MKDIRKELLKPGEVGQLGKGLYVARRREISAECALCHFDGSKHTDDCLKAKCGQLHNLNSVYFVKV